MQDIRIASRYAKSLIDLSSERKELELSYSDMVLINSACSQSKELRSVLNSPVIKSDKKLAILKELFGSHISALSLSFLEILTNKGRENSIPEVASAFVGQYQKLAGITTASVKTSLPLDNENKVKVTELLNKLGYDKVNLNENIDVDILGGFVLRIGDLQIDTSVKSEINRLKQEFKNNLYEEKY